MSISIKNISVAIDGTKSTGFCIELDGTRWRLDNFVLSQSLLSDNFLSFTLHKEPDERINEISFNVCGEIIGKEVQISLETGNIEKESLNAENDSVADIEFTGVIVGASGSRNRSEFVVSVEACSWDALLNDNPTCKSFENLSLNDIVGDVVDDYSEHLDTEIDARYTETIPYCVQYNENNYQFLQRLARRFTAHYDSERNAQSSGR